MLRLDSRLKKLEAKIPTAQPKQHGFLTCETGKAECDCDACEQVIAIREKGEFVFLVRGGQA